MLVQRYVLSRVNIEYASNRGFDSIGIFEVQASTGRLKACDWTDSAGKTPRFFVLSPSGNQLFAANEDSDSIMRFERAAVSGVLTNPAQVATPGSPTCVVFKTRVS